MTTSRHVRWTMTAAIAGALMLALPACDRDDNDHDTHDEFAALEVIDRSTSEVAATWTQAGGWEGQIPAIDLASENQRVSIGFRAFDGDGHEVSLSGEFSIRYALAGGAPTGIIDLDHDDGTLFHGDHVHIYGAAPGTTQVRFLLWHDDHPDDQTAPVDVTVVESM